MTQDARSLLDLPVISIQTGKQLGEVHELLFEPGQHILYGVVVEQSGGRPRLLLERQNIKAVGKDALTIEDESMATVLDQNDRARSLAASGIGHLTGLTVMNEGGDVIGKVDKVLLSDDFTVSSYQASKGLLGFGSKTAIAPGQVITAGSDAIVVRADSDAA